MTTIGDEMAMLAFMSPQAFAYYLPGFMLVGLEAIPVNPAFTDAVVFYLTPRSGSSLSSRERERFSRFVGRQSRAILNWLRVVQSFAEFAPNHTIRADDAIDRYWRAQATDG